MDAKQRRSALLPAVVLAGSALLSGCASSPWMQDLRHGPETASFKESRDDQIRIGYLARYMAEPDTRSRLKSEVANTKYYNQWNAADYGTMTSMVTDAVIGDVGTSLGKDLGATVFVLGLLSGDGSLNYVSQAYLPESYQGQPLDTQATAQSALRSIIESKLNRVADNLGGQLECVQGCGSNHAVYRAPVEIVSFSQRFVYTPQEVYFSVNLLDLKPVDEKDPIHSLVGFPVKWMTPDGNSASVRLFSEIKYGDDGAPVLNMDKDGSVYPSALRRLESAAIGQAILASIYDTPELLWGTQKDYPSRIFFDGQVYGFVSNSYPDFVDRKLLLKKL